MSTPYNIEANILSAHTSVCHASPLYHVSSFRLCIIQSPMLIACVLHDPKISHVLLALNYDRLGDIELESILFMENIPFCAMSTLDELQFTKLMISPEDIRAPVILCYFSLDVLHGILSTLNSLFDDYHKVLVSGVPLMFDTTIRSIINKLLPDMIQDARAKCGAAAQRCNHSHR